MAIERRGATVPGMKAAADYSATQHRFLSVTAADVVTLTGDGARIDGALQNNPEAGQSAEMWSSGSIAKVKASAAISVGASVASAANGEAVTAATGDYIAGPALNAVGASGELVSVLLTFPGRSA